MQTKLDLHISQSFNSCSRHSVPDEKVSWAKVSKGIIAAKSARRVLESISPAFGSEMMEVRCNDDKIYRVSHKFVDLSHRANILTDAHKRSRIRITVCH